MNQRTSLHLAASIASLALAFFAFYACLDNEASVADAQLLAQAQVAPEIHDSVSANWWGSWHRPLPQAFLTWEYRIWGLEFPLYLLVQLLLHVVNATLLFALFRYPTGTPIAATAAMLFALGFGFYGTTIFTVTRVDQMLALTFVLASGVAAARAQLLRTAGQRSASMLLAALLLLTGLACHELAVMALVVMGGFMWPNRRNAFSVVRKLSLLVAALAVWVAYQWRVPGSGPETFREVSSWLWMPWRSLQLASWMLVPADSAAFASETTAWTFRLARLLEQTRPVYGLALGVVLGWWFWRGSGALRWLVSSWIAFLLPVALLASPDTALSPNDVYLAAPFFCGLLALTMRRLWLRSEGVLGRSLLAVAWSLALTVNLLLIRTLEQRSAEGGTTAAARAAQELLQRGVPPVLETPRQDPGTLSWHQKSVPMATLEAGVVVRTSGSYIQAQSNLRTKLPRLMRPPKP